MYTLGYCPHLSELYFSPGEPSDLAKYYNPKEDLPRSERYKMHWIMRT